MTISTSLPTSWEERIEAAAKILGVEPTEVERILSEYGVKKEPCGLEMLSDENITPFGDLRKEFCEKNKFSVPLLRMAMKFLRGPKDSSTTDSIDIDLMELKKKYGVETKLNDLSVEQLLPFYDPKKNNVVATILTKRYGNQRIIAFRPDSTIVALEETLNYICDLETGYGAVDAIEVDGELVCPLPVGQYPNQQVDEDPLYPGQPLKRDRSMTNRATWQDVDKVERQFFRILVLRGDIKANDRINLNAIIGKKINELKVIFPEAYLEYKELKRKDELPKLMMDIKEATTKRIQNPFETKTGNRTY